MEAEPLPLWLVGELAAVGLAFGPVVGLLLMRNRLGPLHAAAGLVIWGAFVIAGEHGSFALSLAVSLGEAPGVADHARFHFFMAGAYVFVAAFLIAFVAWRLLRQGSRTGWYALLVAFLFGTALEAVAGTTIFPHGIPPRSIPLGLALYAYIAAFGGALIVSYQPIFRAGTA